VRHNWGSGNPSNPAENLNIHDLCAPDALIEKFHRLDLWRDAGPIEDVRRWPG
jgi:hypothetical protein